MSVVSCKSLFWRIFAGAALACASLAAALALIIAVRSPVVVVTDPAFTALYGESRQEKERLRCSLRYLRSFRTASVDTKASPESAADAVAAVAHKPFLVVFPGRFSRGRAVYLQRNPAVPCILLDGKGAFPVDQNLDRYRAGRLAGLLCRKGGSPAILVSREPGDPGLDSLLAGLASSGFRDSPMIVSRDDRPDTSRRPVCLVLLSPGLVPIPSEWRQIPLILFSWMNPEYAGQALVVSFDDSPWASISFIMENMESPRAVRWPSHVTVSRKPERFSLKRAEIRSILAESFEKE